MQKTHKIAGIILAAGASKRMGAQNKLLLPIGDETVIKRTVRNYKQAALDPLFVVTGYEADEISEQIFELNVCVAHNPDFENGLASSLSRGITALGDHAEIDGALIGLGDMPFIESSHLEQIMKQFDPQHERSLVVPVYNGKRGNPVLWGARFFEEIAQLQGDVGARQLLERHADQVTVIEIENESVRTDIDTPADYEKLSKQFK